MYGRPVVFWLLVFLVLCGLLWLLGEILLPFVAGIALAYLAAPLADRMERLGINRTVAALLIVIAVTLMLVATALLVVPYVMQQLLSLIATIPRHVARVREIVADPTHPWLNWLVSGDQSKTVSEFVGHASSWLTAFAYSLWSGGKALISFVSVLIIMPVVTFYLICDWHGMMQILDRWIPPRHRDTVRELARDIDHAISGFIRGQLVVCFLLGLYYAIALTFLVTELRSAYRTDCRPDHIRTLHRIAHWPSDRDRGGGRAVLAGLEMDRGGGCHLPRWPIRRRKYHCAKTRRRAGGIAPGLDHFRDVRVRLSVRLRGLATSRSTRRLDRSAVSFRTAPLPGESDLYRWKGNLSAMADAPRQLALALDHAESLRARTFSAAHRMRRRSR